MIPCAKLVTIDIDLPATSLPTGLPAGVDATGEEERERPGCRHPESRAADRAATPDRNTRDKG